MANPITWKNVAAPNFNASNVLAMSAAKQLGDAFQSGSDRLIEQGEFNEKQNTDALIGKIGAYQDYDALANAKAGIFSGMDGQNIDEGAIADYFGTQQTVLGQREEFNVGRKDRADTQAGNAFLTDLMNNGENNERNLLSALSQYQQDNGLSNTAFNNISTGLKSKFAPTTKEAAESAAAIVAQEQAFDIRLQDIKEAGDLAAAEAKGNRKGSSTSSDKFGDTLQSKNWKTFFETDEDAQNRYKGTRKTYLDAGINADVFDRTVQKYYDPSEQTIKFGALEKELKQIQAANYQSDQYNGLSEFEKTIQAQSLAAQSNGAITEAQARDMLDLKFGAK